MCIKMLSVTNEINSMRFNGVILLSVSRNLSNACVIAIGSRL